MLSKLEKLNMTNEDPYLYKPFKDSQRTYVWDDSARQDLKDYNLDDLSI
jgi:hypothetical protein